MSSYHQTASLLPLHATGCVNRPFIFQTRKEDAPFWLHFIRMPQQGDLKLMSSLLTVMRLRPHPFVLDPVINSGAET